MARTTEHPLPPPLDAETSKQMAAQRARQQNAASGLRLPDSTTIAFLQAVSHQLRTPLAAVLGMALTLEQRIDELGDEDRAMLVSRLAANARALDQMLSDLLDLDRPGGGASLRLMPEPTTAARHATAG